MLRRFTSSAILLSAAAPSCVAPVSSVTATQSTTAHLVDSYRRVHQRLPTPRQPILADDRLETAKAALLQLNLMVTQGIEPDAEMYTSLIATMGKAKLEWQAFKLFSRMLEQGVKPLPETYLALKRATSPMRARVIEQIEARMAQAAALVPRQLAAAISEQHEQSRRAADKNMRQMLDPDSFTTNTPIDSSDPSGAVMDDAESSRRRQEKIRGAHAQASSDGDLPTMRIDSVEAVMATIEQLDARSRQSESVAKGEQRVSLLKRLEKLHEEELKVLLTIHKQSRVGNSKEQLLRRVVSQVPATYIEQMLDRRAHYFDSVKQALEIQILELKESQPQEQQQQQHQVRTQKTSASTDAVVKQTDASSSSDIDTFSALAANSSSASPSPLTPTDASALTEHEKFSLSPPFLEAPWGLLRKPTRPPANAPSGRNEERDEDLLLSQEELAVLENSLSSSQSLDAIPARLLRRYCRHFHLKWRRKKGRAEIQDLVEWHLRNFKPNNAAASSGDTVVNRRPDFAEIEMSRNDAEEQERRAQQQTIEHYNSLLAVASVTENMSMVDDAEISRVVIQQRAHERYMKKAAAQQLERERIQQRKQKLDEASKQMPSGRSSGVFAGSESPAREGKSSTTSMSSSTTSFFPPSSSSSSSSVLLGLDSDSSRRGGQDRRYAPYSSSSSSAAVVQELPPWEAMSSSVPLNLRTGKFDVNVPHAEFYEDATGRVKIRQPPQLRGTYSVDVNLLPSQKQAALREQKLEQQEIEDRNQAAEERRREFRAKSSRARKFDSWIEKKQQEGLEAKQEAAGGESSAAAVPQGVPRRMASKMRAGQLPFAASRRRSFAQ